MQRLRRGYAWVLRHGPRLRDLGFVGISLLYVVALGASSPSDGAATVVVGLVAALALLWRRRYPVAVTLVAVVGQAVALMIPSLGFALFSLAIRRRDTALAVLGLAGYAAYVVPALHSDSGTLWGSVLSGPFVIGSFIAAGAYVGARRDLLVSLRERAERAEAERELRGDQARLAERARIAQEMHDVLAHKVSLIALHAGGLEVNPAMGADKVEASAGLIRQTARQAMEDLREVLGVLRRDLSPDGADLSPVPTRADLEGLVAASRAAGVVVSAEIALPPQVPDLLGRTVYRIVQEALTNVHKHARGAATDVRVTGAAGHGVTVRVGNLRPVSAAALLPGAGAGLVGLRERVNLVHGTLTAGPTTDGGWRVEAWLPWEEIA